MIGWKGCEIGVGFGVLSCLIRRWCALMAGGNREVFGYACWVSDAVLCHYAHPCWSALKLVARTPGHPVLLEEEQPDLSCTWLRLRRFCAAK